MLKMKRSYLKTNLDLGHDTPQAVTLITDKIQKATENYVRGYF